jgi:gluconolactonase
MRPRFPFLVLLVIAAAMRAADDYKPGPDSLPQEGVPKGERIKGQYTAKEGSVFPGTERDYTIYLPPGLDKSQPAPFMVFQDGVIYQAPTVFDNLIAKKEIPPLIGIFIKPGVVPAANPNALPRFNRSYEYDSVTDTYAHFLIDEFLPAISQKHGLNLSTNPNDAAIVGNSSGGICAFMVAWHCPDRFRRVFTGVGTYVGIHGADQLPVLVRKMEPKPLRVYLQSGINDNNLQAGDWWMANQMMERSLTWAGYDVNHTWGEGGHNQKQATAIFPDVLRWLWKGWPEQKEVKANPRGDSKWKGYEVLGDEGWMECTFPVDFPSWARLCSNQKGDMLAWGGGPLPWKFVLFPTSGDAHLLKLPLPYVKTVAWTRDDVLVLLAGKSNSADGKRELYKLHPDGSLAKWAEAIGGYPDAMVMTHDGKLYCTDRDWLACLKSNGEIIDAAGMADLYISRLALSPDQSLLYAVTSDARKAGEISSWQIQPDGRVGKEQFGYFQLEGDEHASGLCVDTEGRLYVATSLGVQVCDQAGRVNFIIPTPNLPYDVCFGGKDLGDLFIACGDKIYKRSMKVHGIVSGQMPPIKPAPPHL